MLKLAVLHAEFLAWSRRRGAAGPTLHNDRVAARAFGLFLAEQTIEDLGRITPAEIAAFQAYLARVDSVRGRPYAAGTRLGFLAWVRKFFGYLHREGLILVDPTSRMRLPRKPRRLPRAVLSADEMRQLLWTPDVSTPGGLRDRAILEILYGLGLRFSELANLTVADVDLEERTLWVRQGKGKRDRLLPLGRWSTHWLRRYLDASDPARREQGTDLVFLTPRRKRLTNWVLVRILRAYAHRAGITKPITPHTLRHSFATAMLKGGADIRGLQRFLGHTQITSTEVYTHLDLGDLRRAQDRCHPRERRQTPPAPEKP